MTVLKTSLCYLITGIQQTGKIEKSSQTKITIYGSNKKEGMERRGNKTQTKQTIISVLQFLAYSVNFYNFSASQQFISKQNCEED